MRGCAAVGVDDDFASGQTAVAVRAANHEFAGGVDQIFGFCREHFGRQYGLDNLLDYLFFQLFMADFGVVLGGKDDGVNAFDFTCFAVIRHG